MFVDELQNTEDLRLLVLNYLKDVSPNPTVVDNIIKYELPKTVACVGGGAGLVLKLADQFII